MEKALRNREDTNGIEMPGVVTLLILAGGLFVAFLILKRLRGVKVETAVRKLALREQVRRD